jgi:6-phosphogluconolactonase
MEDESRKECTPEIRISPDLATLSRAAAQALTDLIAQRTAASNPFSLVLSGGETPRALYQLLATEFRERIDWPKVHLFWGDERYVPRTDRRSNYRMVKESLLDHVSLPAANVHPMLTELARPDESALEYEASLRAFFHSPPAQWPTFDLILLGLGEEGHTASLFPRSPALGEQHRWVAAVRVPAEPPLRLTLTLPALNHAKQVYFLAAGSKKAGAVRAGTASASGDLSCPAAMVRPQGGNLIWWIDQSAASA